jgi:DNA-binding response OmpR family regulator
MADYTILIIDYEPRSIDRLRVPLERAGYAVEVAKNGMEGIRKFHALEPAAVIIEAMLPKRHGFEVCQELKQTPHGSRCPVMIATSVYRGRRYRHQATHLYSCDAYLEKPLTDEDLLSTIETSMNEYATANETKQDDSAETMQIDTTQLATDEPQAPQAAASTTPDASPSNGGPESVSRASGDSADDDFEILDRLDSLLSDDPSKSSPTRTDK